MVNACDFIKSLYTSNFNDDEISKALKNKEYTIACGPYEGTTGRIKEAHNDSIGKVRIPALWVIKVDFKVGRNYYIINPSCIDVDELSTTKNNKVKVTKCLEL